MEFESARGSRLRGILRRFYPTFTTSPGPTLTRVNFSCQISPSGRFQVIEEKKPKQRILSSEGVRWDAAVTALILAGALMAAILLADLAGIGTGGRTLEKLSGKIESLENRNGQLREELVLSTGNASVCTEAVKMDLISSNGARTIRLTAPGNARLTLSTASAAAENEELAGRMISYAGD